MSFGQLYFSFEGRISRSTYWLKGFLPMFAIAIVVAIVAVIATAGGVLVIATAGGVLSIIWSLIAIWPCLAITAKRWHDRDKSAWWILIVFIPIIGPIWYLVEVGFLKGTDGENRFGPDPLKT